RVVNGHHCFVGTKRLCGALQFVRDTGFARRGRYDVIHAVEESVFFGLILGSLFRIPYIYDMYSSLPEQMIERYPMLGRLRRALEAMERLAVRRATAILTVD